MSHFVPRIALLLLIAGCAAVSAPAQRKAKPQAALLTAPKATPQPARTASAERKVMPAPAAGKATSHRRAALRSAKAPVAPQPAPVPQTPPPPPTPEQMPPTPPQVTYQNGMLTIVAQNSTLGDILSAVRARTGAAVEVPPGAGRERVATSIGPAPPRDALDTLLGGSRFNYLILSAEDNPEGVQRVILLARTAAEPTAAAANRPGARPAQPVNAVGEGEGENNEDESAGGDDFSPPNEVAPPPEPAQVQPPVPSQPGQPAPGQPVPAQPGAPQVPNPDQNAPANQPQAKTPEQLLQELQRMQQQQQQQQRQNQGQLPPTLPPTQVPPDEPQSPPPEQPSAQPEASPHTAPPDQAAPSQAPPTDQTPPPPQL